MSFLVSPSSGVTRTFTEHVSTGTSSQTGEQVVVHQGSWKEESNKRYATPDQVMRQWFEFDAFTASLRWMGMGQRAASVGGFALNMIGNPKAMVANGLAKFSEKNAGRLFYHYTDEAGAKAIQESGMLLPNAKGQVFLTQEQLTQAEANYVLFLGRGGNRGSHVVEVMVKDGVYITPGKNANEFIHRGVMRDGRQADMTVGPNGF